MLPPNLVLLLWIPITVLLFFRSPPRLAIIICLVCGVLFLPQGVTFELPVIPDYTSRTAVPYALLVSLILFDLSTLLKYRVSWVDIPMVTLCVAPIFTSLYNSLGFYDGFNESLSQLMTWGIPYLIGRLYFNNLLVFRHLAVGIFVGGLIYIPLCLFEIVMSPQLHNIFYGYHAQMFAQAIRYGGYRPSVFMAHGLEVGLWVNLAAFIGFCLWRTKTLNKLWNLPISYLFFALLTTSFLIKSTGASVLLGVGLFLVTLCELTSSVIPLVVIVALISIYLIVSSLFDVDKSGVISFLSNIFGEDRAQSLEFRFLNEDLLSNKAREQILWGWGGWNRNRVFAENWDGQMVDITVPDSRWILVFGVNGVFGLVSYYLSFLLPIYLFTTRYPTRLWKQPTYAPFVAITFSVLLFTLDSLVNSSSSPVFVAATGGLLNAVTLNSKLKW